MTDPAAIHRGDSKPARRWPLLLLLIGAIVGTSLLVVHPDRTHAQRRAAGARYFELAKADEAALPGPMPNARVGDRWSFQSASLYKGELGLETWDVLDLRQDSVLLRVAATATTPREEGWRFTVRGVRPERVTDCTREVLDVPGLGPIPCAVVSARDAGGIDDVILWIAIDEVTGQPTFPGVLRLRRRESRGRTAVEWDAVSVTRGGPARGD